MPPLGDPSNRAKKSLYTRFFQTKLFAAFLLFSAAFQPPVMVAHAGVFSFVSGFFKTEVSAQESSSELNSQNMPLLKAVPSYDPNPSKGGGDITIVDGSALLPDVGPSGTLADIEHHPASDQISIYVVRDGDSLSQIATMFEVSPNTIIWANDLKSKLLTVGQTLVILPISGVRHTVKRGDTLGSIAKKYNAHLEEIAQFNDVAENTALAVGDVVVVPDGEIAVETPPGSKSPSPRRTGASSGASYQGYYVRPVAGSVRTQGLHGYNGVDLSAPEGTPIVAAAAGEVIISRDSGWNGGYGSYIVIKHNNRTQTLYAHTEKNIVFDGAHVVQGQVIGYIGSTGKSTGYHLHFEVRGARNPF